MATRGKGIIFHIVYLYFVLYLLSMKFYANASKSDRRKCQAYPINATDTKEDVLQKRIACRSLFKLYPRSTRKSSVVRTQQTKMFPFVGRRHHELAKHSRPKRFYPRTFYQSENRIPIFPGVMPFVPDLPLTTTEDTPLPWTTRKFDFIIVQGFQPLVPTPGQHASALTDPCLSGPCINKGTCTRDLSEGQRGYICTCPSGFQGHHCEEGALTDPCLSGPCLNKGTCTRDLSKGPHGYICTCPSGFQGHHCEEEIKQYTVTEDSLLKIEDLIGGAIAIWALISLFVIVHCVRVSRRRSELTKEYKKKLASGDILPLPPPDWCDVSNALCQGFFCYCCRNCGEESDSEQAVPLLEQYQDSAQKKEDQLKRQLNRTTEDVLRKVSSRSLVPGSLPQGPPGRRLSSSNQVTPLLSQVYESYPGTSQAVKSPEEDTNPHTSENDEDDEEEEEESEEEDSEEGDREEGENKEREEMEYFFDAENKMGGGMQAVMHTGNAHDLMMTHNGDKIDNFNQRQTYGGIYGPQRNSFQEMRNINNQASPASFIYEYPYDPRMSAYYKYRQQRQSSMYHYNKNCNHFSNQHEQSQQKEHESHPAEQGQQSNNLPFPGMQIQDNVNASYSHHTECDQQQQNSSENTDLVKSDVTDLVKCQGPLFYRPWTRAEQKLSKVSHFHIPSPSPTAATSSQPRAGHSSDANKTTSPGTCPQNSYSRSFGNRHQRGTTNTASFPTSEIEQNATNIPGEIKTKLPKALTHKQVSFATHFISRVPDRTQEDSALANLVSVETFAQQNSSSVRNPPVDGEPPSFASHGNYADLRPSTSSHFPVLPETSRNCFTQDDVPSTPSSIPVMFVPTYNSSPVDTHLDMFTSKSKDDSGMFVSSIKTAAQGSHGMPSVCPTTRFMPVSSSQPMNGESSKGNSTVLEDSPKPIYNGEAKTKGLILMRRFRFNVTNANTNSEGSHIYYGTNLPSDYCNNSHVYASLDFGDGVGLHKINERTRSKDMDIVDNNDSKTDSKSDEIFLDMLLKDEDEDFSNRGDLDIDFNLISFDDGPSDSYANQCSSNLLKASVEFSARDQMRPSNDSEEGQTITADFNESISRFMNQSFGLESDTSTIVGDDNQMLGKGGEKPVHIIDFSDLTQSLQ